VDDWRRYPYELAPGFCFPAAEANHPDCESDTWFLAGELAGDSGRRFAYLSIFNKNRPGPSVVADFYTFALFDLDTGTYATYTDYDMPSVNRRSAASPKLSVANGHLDIEFESGAGTAVWRTSRDARGALVPFTYDVGLVGDGMVLELHVTPSRAPVPLGAAAYNGKIECFGQPGTYSYFQTRMTMVGTLQWGAVQESVSGTAGHIDRQWFPLVANSGGSNGDMRSRAHEWRTINLDNGIDLSIWRQFDRTKCNALQAFSGITTSSGDHAEYAEDVEVEILSYVLWPESVRTLVPPPAKVRYMPDRHRLASETLDLHLIGEPLVAAPAHALPIEYMEGPYRYSGTLRGQPVSGFGFYERSLALYRDWELVDVLAAAVGESRVALVRDLIADCRRDEAVKHLSTMRSDHAEVTQIVDELVGSLSRH
jgi:predicted secreted hydrolase